MLLNSLHIKGFRGFADFKVAGLGQVNLIVGRNNAGKTSLLEAIYLLSAGIGNPFWAIQRGEDLAAAQLGLFTGRPQYGSSAEIEMSTEREPTPLTMKLKQTDIELYRPPWGGEAFAIGSPARGLPTSSPVLLEPGPSATFNGAQVWDRILLTPRHDDVKACLRLIQPDLVDVALAATNGRPIVRLEGATGPVSVASLGGGSARLFQLACGLVVSENNVLLVDEIENGLHHSLHGEMWKFVFAVAQRYNVQVFAATHGLDCFRGFAWASRELPEAAARVIRLDNHGREIVPVMFDEREAQVAAREDIEIR